MPLTKLSFRPGISKESTTYANEGGFFDGNWVRFRSGYPEKIGGWQNISFSNTYKGTARSLLSWVDYDSNSLIAFGTNQKYYVELSNEYHDITPVRTGPVTLGASPISVEDGSRIVTITHSSHGAVVGSCVRLTSTSSVGGLSISGEYEIITTPTGNTYTILASSAATSTTTGGGTVTATYDINAGAAIFTTITGGWSAGAFGNGGWGQSTGVAGTAPIQLWSQTTYGEDLIFASRGGTVYYWDNDIPTFARAVTLASRTDTLSKVATTATSAGIGTTITVADTTGIDIGAVVTGTNVVAGTKITAINFLTKVVTLSVATTGAASGNYIFSYVGNAVPVKTEAVFGSDVYKFIVCLGANPYEPGNFSTTYDPMLVRWSDQDNCYEWIPEATNQAGEKKLSIGSYLVCAQNTRQEVLIWSDAALYSMQYIGPPYVFNFTLLADNISIASPNATATANNIIYWMGRDKFYVYSGRVDTLNCTLWDHVFRDINKEQMFQIVAGTNEAFNEIWWFYPSANSTINDRYVIYNTVEQVWYHGNLTRTAWLDTSLRNYPVGAFSVQNTYLSEALSDSATEIAVINASTYPVSGTLVIGSEEITYTGRTGSKFTGCTRGVNLTTAASHPLYEYVTYKAANQLMYHELGVDDQSTNIPAPISAYITSADFDIGDGHNFGFVWRMLPDLTFSGTTVEDPGQPQVTLSLEARNNSGTAYNSTSSPTVTRTYEIPVERYTGQVYTRLRGRQMRFTLSSDGIGVNWQLGQVRIDIRPDGRSA